VIAYRWGWINNHQYIVRVTNDLQAARDAADAEAAHRGGKYSVTVWDNEGSAVHHASSCYGEPKAHVNYRVDMMESVGCAVVAALEDGHPLTTDQIAERWKRDVKTQEIMESVDRNQSNAHALAEERSDDSQQRVVGGGIDHAS
jgi:hypothetical protein